MVAARQDKVVPPAATKALHDSIGEQAELIWLDAGHVGSGKYLLSEIVRIQDFFTEWNQEGWDYRRNLFWPDYGSLFCRITS